MTQRTALFVVVTRFIGCVSTEKVPNMEQINGFVHSFNLLPFQTAYILNKTEYKVQIKMHQVKIYRLSLFLHFLT